MATTDILNSLLRGEIAATETYDQALQKLGGERGADKLRRIWQDHRDAAQALRLHVHSCDEHTSSGAWGTFAKAVEGTAKLFGKDATLKALKEGEEHGVKQYEEARDDEHLPRESRALIGSTLLPSASEHIRVLNQLMSGFVDRVGPQQALQLMEFNDDAMLVCAYDDHEQFRDNRLQGAISLYELKQLEPTIPKDTEIIFYCA
jgi:hypothetical protein